MSLYHESCERLPTFPPSSLSPVFGLAEAVAPYLLGDGPHSAINDTLRRRHYHRWEVTVTYDHSVASPPVAAIIAQRVNALLSLAEPAFPIEIRSMSADVWKAKVSQRHEELRLALSHVHSKDRFLHRSRIPHSVWVELTGRAAILMRTFGMTSAPISLACKEFLLQTQHANAAKAALEELSCPSRPRELEAKRSRLVKAWLQARMTKDRKSGQLKPTRSRDELRADVVSWNFTNRFTRGQAGFLSKRGSSAELIQKLAEASVNKQLAADGAVAAEQRMGSCPGLGANEVPPAGIPPSEWSSTTARGRELLLAAAAAQCEHSATWFRDRAQLVDEVEPEERNIYDDERDFGSDASEVRIEDWAEAMAAEYDI